LFQNPLAFWDSLISKTNVFKINQPYLKLVYYHFKKISTMRNGGGAGAGVPSLSRR
jgi:hypothetical protein